MHLAHFGSLSKLRFACFHTYNYVIKRDLVSFLNGVVSLVSFLFISVSQIVQAMREVSLFSFILERCTTHRRMRTLTVSASKHFELSDNIIYLKA